MNGGMKYEALQKIQTKNKVWTNNIFSDKDSNQI